MPNIQLPKALEAWISRPSKAVSVLLSRELIFDRNDKRR